MYVQQLFCKTLAQRGTKFVGFPDECAVRLASSYIGKMSRRQVSGHAGDGCYMAASRASDPVFRPSQCGSTFQGQADEKEL